MIPPPFAGTEKREQRQQTQTNAQEAQNRNKRQRKANVVVAFGLRLLEIERERDCVGWGGQAKTVQNPHSPTLVFFAFRWLGFIFFFFINNFLHCSVRPSTKTKGGVFITNDQQIYHFFSHSKPSVKRVFLFCEFLIQEN